MWKYEFYKQKNLEPMIFVLTGKPVNGISIRHQLQKFGFCQSETIPQVKFFKHAEKVVETGKMGFFIVKLNFFKRETEMGQFSNRNQSGSKPCKNSWKIGEY